MYGAIIGDMIGVPFEYDRGEKRKDIELWTQHSRFSDDTIMTCAVADALMQCKKIEQDPVCNKLMDVMHSWGDRYPHEGYGAAFEGWLTFHRKTPYNSYGNGAAMRVSPAGWLYETLDETRKVARYTAIVSHDHPEGIKGAESVATAIWLARNGYNKDYIKKYIVDNFGYDLSRTLDEIRPGYCHKEICQETVPEAITAFLEGTDFEDVIRNAVSLGGDCDTLTAIAGSIAEAFYGVPDSFKEEARKRMKPDMIEVLDKFYEYKSGVRPKKFRLFLKKS